MGINTYFYNYLSLPVRAAPLAVFRITFGLLMAIGVVRFWYHGWIDTLYIQPDFHFKYLWFEWVRVPPPPICYLLFVACGLSALAVAVGYQYRRAIIVFFLSFTYIELMDKTTYLNHYYFVSVIGFMLIFLPAGCYFSVDAYRSAAKRWEYIPRWNVDAIKCMLALVYIFAGAAKINEDWLLRAMPLAIWLPTKFDIPILGNIMHEKWVHYFFSWSGALYDLCIPFLLWWQRSRLLAFMAVVCFHVLTRILFPIGMFPYIMIAATLIFFSPSFHFSLLSWLAKGIGFTKSIFDNGQILKHSHSLWNRLSFYIIIALLLVQSLLPLRYLLYPGNIFWTEEGFRFAWRVMLMEKTGYANFKVIDKKSNTRFYVDNDDFLTPFQQKQMATQPDFIIQYAHYLGRHFNEQGQSDIAIYVESYAALNGRESQVYFDPDIDLLTLRNDLFHNPYILPLHE